jgi:hypothetical protein
MWKNIVERGRRQMAVWRMRIACWVTEATGTLRICNTSCFFSHQQWLHERASVLYAHCLSFYNKDSVFTAKYELIFRYSLDYMYSQSLNGQQQYFPYSVHITDTLYDLFHHNYTYFDDTNPFYSRSARSQCQLFHHYAQQRLLDMQPFVLRREMGCLRFQTVKCSKQVPILTKFSAKKTPSPELFPMYATKAYGGVEE